MQQLQQYVSDNSGQFPSHKGASGSNERHLYQWCKKMRSRRRHQNLSVEEQHALEAIKKWNWGREAIGKRLGFDKQLQLLKQFLLQEGGRLPRTREWYEEQEQDLGRWCNYLRRQQRDGKLKPAWFEELDQLTAIGWTWLEVGATLCSGGCHVSAMMLHMHQCCQWLAAHTVHAVRMHSAWCVTMLTKGTGSAAARIGSERLQAQCVFV